MGQREPHWPINLVKELALEGSFEVRWERAEAFLGGEARSVVQKVLTGLEPSSFAETVFMRLTGAPADVYGIKLVDGGWYLKLTIAEKESVDLSESKVVVISLHPLKTPIETKGGRVKR